MKIKSGKAEFDKTDKFSMILPENKDFQKLDLGKDLSADIRNRVHSLRNFDFIA